MKATVRDADALQSVPPLEFAAYLRASGWHEHERFSERASVWALEDGTDEGYEILLPLSRDYKDFCCSHK